MAISPRLFLARLASRFVIGLATACLAAPLSILAPTAEAAGPVLKSQGPCARDPTGACLRFDQEDLPPKVVRALDFNAPSAGQALVSVLGSGFCRHDDSTERHVRFATQIVNNPNAVATYTGPGGNRFVFTLSKGYQNGTGVFNLASERLFAISAAGLQRYSLNIDVPAIEQNVDCFVYSVALTVLFLPR